MVKIDSRASIWDSPGEGKREREMSRTRLRRPSERCASLDVSTDESVEECNRPGQTYEIGRRQGQTRAEQGQTVARRCHIVSNLIRYRPTPGTRPLPLSPTPARSSLCLSATLVPACDRRYASRMRVDSRAHVPHTHTSRSQQLTLICAWRTIALRIPTNVRLLSCKSGPSRSPVARLASCACQALSRIGTNTFSPHNVL